MSPLPPSESKTALEATAIRFLSYRPRFRAEVITRLTKKAKEYRLTDSLTLINQIVVSLEKAGFINDAANLERYIRYRLDTKFKGPRWLLAQLLHLGVRRAEIEKALVQHADRRSQIAAVKRFIIKKTRGSSLSLKVKAKLYRALISRGFSASLIASAFDERGGEEV